MRKGENRSLTLTFFIQGFFFKFPRLLRLSLIHQYSKAIVLCAHNRCITPTYKRQLVDQTDQLRKTLNFTAEEAKHFYFLS